MRVFAQVADDARRALRSTCDAGVAPVEDQPVMRISAEFRGRGGSQCLLHFPRRSAGGKPGAVGYPENVRVDRDLHLTEHHVEDDVGGLAANAWERLELGA